jgi:hypothetical protein
MKVANAASLSVKDWSQQQKQDEDQQDLLQLLQEIKELQSPDRKVPKKVSRPVVTGSSNAFDDLISDQLTTDHIQMKPPTNSLNKIIDLSLPKLQEQRPNMNKEATTLDEMDIDAILGESQSLLAKWKYF